MWLINAKELQLEKFSDDRAVPPYAILSHRWVENQEVMFSEMRNPDRDNAKDSDRKNIRGWRKIEKCCKRAIDQKLTHVWVDTCCIDQNSSAELSEAINSMYRWYENARVCYAYLADVRQSDDEPTWLEEFKQSEWFTRAWTLQELIAPLEVRFFDHSWKFLGRKFRRYWDVTDDDTLVRSIESATGIPSNVLTGKTSLENYSIAQKMSWASKRNATRVEDIAYSLLGLFDVNMPMIYGEGKKAFLRLQEEIIKQTNDHTIFAWSGRDRDEPISSISNSPTLPLGDFYNSLTKMSDGQQGHSATRSLLAKSPEYFQDCKDMSKGTMLQKQEPYSITNLGLSIRLPLSPWAMDHYLAILDCSNRDGLGGQIAIFLRQSPGTDSFVRVEIKGEDLQYVKHTPRPQQQRRIYIRLLKSSSVAQTTYRNLNPLPNSIYGFKIAPAAIFKRNENTLEDLYTVCSHNTWSRDKRILEIPAGLCGTAGIIDVSKQNLFVATIKLGFDFDFNPVCIIADHTASTTFQQPDWTTWTYSQDGSDDLAGKNIFQVNCMETRGWNEIEHRQVVPNPNLVKGIWALKGTSALGLSFEIPTLRLTVDIKKRSEGEQSIWVFDSEGLSVKRSDYHLPTRSATA